MAAATSCAPRSRKNLASTANNIVLGNGSNEIIEFVGHAFLQPGDDIVVADHAFVVYKLMATLFGAEHDRGAGSGIRARPRRDGGGGHAEDQAGLHRQPEQPDRAPWSRSRTIERFMDKVPEHVVVIFDEAYYEFLDTPPDTLKFVREGRNVVVLRTFSKIQGLAALRIGYGLAPAHIAERAPEDPPAFQCQRDRAGGCARRLARRGAPGQDQSITDEGRAFLESSFADMGLEYVPSHANFVLVKVGDGDASIPRMMKQGRHHPGDARLQTARVGSDLRRDDGAEPRCLEVLRERAS